MKAYGVNIRPRETYTKPPTIVCSVARVRLKFVYYHLLKILRLAHLPRTKPSSKALPDLDYPSLPHPWHHQYPTRELAIYLHLNKPNNSIPESPYQTFNHQHVEVPSWSFDVHARMLKDSRSKHGYRSVTKVQF